MTNLLKGKRTIIWNVLNGLIYMMDQFTAQYNVPPEFEQLWMGVYVAGNIILRYMTDTKVFSQK